MSDLNINESAVILAMVVLMLGGLAGGLWDRARQNKSITDRFIQFLGVCWIIGATVILATIDQLNWAAATIFSAMAGYLFALQKRTKTDKDSGRKS